MKFVWKALESLGFNEKEIDCYLCLLEFGELQASWISKKVGINRSTVQYCCQQLAKKGVVTSRLDGNTILYSANDVSVLERLIEDEMALVKKKSENFKGIVGELNRLKKKDFDLPKVRFFEGMIGLKEAFEDDLNNVKFMYSVIRVDENTDEEFLEYMKSDFRGKLKIDYKSFSLINSTEIAKNFFKDDPIKERRVVVLNEDKFMFDSCVHIYNGKVCFYSVKKGALSAVIVEDEKVFRTVLSLFKAAWEFGIRNG